MSDVPQGPGWWQASDLRWYPPEARPAAPPSPSPGGPVGVGVPTSYPYPYAAPVLPSVQNQAVTSLVLGILGLVPCWPMTIALGWIAIVLGAIALTKVRRGQARDEGRGMAIAGIVLGIAGTLLPILAMMVILISDSSQYGLLRPGAGT